MTSKRIGTGLGAEGNGQSRPLGRISLPDREQLSPEQRKVYDDVVNGPRGIVIGPLRAVIHSPELADRWQRFGEYIRYRTVLPEALKELAIIICSRRWNSELEWAVHSKVAREAGLPEAIIEDIRLGRAPQFEDDDAAAIYEFTRELQLRGDVGDPVYVAVKERWGERGIVELTAVVGYYTMVAMMLNAHHVPLPDGMIHALQDSDPKGGLSDLPPLTQAESGPENKAGS